MRVARPLAAATGLLALAACTIPVAGPSALSRVAVDASGRVSVPLCPDWSRSSREDFSNRDASNFGCADALNFVAQLADTRDVAQGRTVGAQDGGAAASAVERYRTGKTRPLAAGSTQGGGGGSAAPEGGQ